MVAALLEKAWICAVRDAKIELSYRISFLLDLVDGLLFVLAYAFVARLFGASRPDGYEPLGFMLVGIAVNGALMTALICFAQTIRGAQVAGTIKAVMVTPTSPLTVVVLSSIYPLARATLDVAIWLGAAWLCGVSMAVANPVASSVVFVMAAFATAGLGFASAAFAVVFKRGDPITWLFATLSFLLSGVLYPTSTLPAAFSWVSDWLPTTHALSAMRATVLDGASLADVAAELTALAGFAVVGIPLGLLTLAAAIQRARRTGTLGHR